LALVDRSSIIQLIEKSHQSSALRQTSYEKFNIGNETITQKIEIKCDANPSGFLSLQMHMLGLGSFAKCNKQTSRLLLPLIVSFIVSRLLHEKLPNKFSQSLFWRTARELQEENFVASLGFNFLTAKTSDGVNYNAIFHAMK
jgi:hypothetical protein